MPRQPVVAGDTCIHERGDRIRIALERVVEDLEGPSDRIGYERLRGSAFPLPRPGPGGSQGAKRAKRRFDSVPIRGIMGFGFRATGTFAHGR